MAVIGDEHLRYFKDLLEGRAEISWNAWFRRHEKALSEELPRMQFLKLKFNKLDEAERLLRESQIEYSLSPLARRERYYAMFHDSVLDEIGRPKEEFLRQRYDGAVGQFLDGDRTKARERIAAYLKKIRRYPQLQRMEALEEMEFIAENEFELGNKELGRMMLELVAAYPAGDDLLDPAIFRAQELLGLRAAKA